jgi:hypothetical protein
LCSQRWERRNDDERNDSNGNSEVHGWFLLGSFEKSYGIDAHSRRVPEDAHDENLTLSCDPSDVPMTSVPDNDRQLSVTA